MTNNEQIGGLGGKMLYYLISAHIKHQLRNKIWYKLNADIPLGKREELVDQISGIIMKNNNVDNIIQRFSSDAVNTIETGGVMGVEVVIGMVPFVGDLINGAISTVYEGLNAGTLAINVSQLKSNLTEDIPTVYRPAASTGRSKADAAKLKESLEQVEHNPAATAQSHEELKNLNVPPDALDNHNNPPKESPPKSGILHRVREKFRKATPEEKAEKAKKKLEKSNAKTARQTQRLQEKAKKAKDKAVAARAKADAHGNKAHKAPEKQSRWKQFTHKLPSRPRLPRMRPKRGGRKTRKYKRMMGGTILERPVEEMAHNMIMDHITDKLKEKTFQGIEEECESKGQTCDPNQMHIATQKMIDKIENDPQVSRLQQQVATHGANVITSSTVLGTEELTDVIPGIGDMINAAIDALYLAFNFAYEITDMLHIHQKLFRPLNRITETIETKHKNEALKNVVKRATMRKDKRASELRDFNKIRVELEKRKALNSSDYQLANKVLQGGAIENKIIENKIINNKTKKVHNKKNILKIYKNKLKTIKKIKLSNKEKKQLKPHAEILASKTASIAQKKQALNIALNMVLEK